MKNSGLVIFSLLFVPTLAMAQTQFNQNLSNLMGAVTQVIETQTQIPGVKEKVAEATPPAQKVFHTMQNDLENCQTTKSNQPELVSVEKDGVSVQFKKFDLKISGHRCPLDLSVSLSATDQTEETLSASFVMKMIFKSDAMIQKYKMKSVEASGEVRAKAQKNGDTITVPVHVDINGKGESTDIGPFSQSISLDLITNANLAQFSFDMLTEQTAVMQFKGETQKAYARIKMAGFTQPEANYTINDKPVSQSEFQTFVQSFAIPGLVSVDDPNAPDSKVITQCHFAAYDKKAISAADLKSQLQANNLQAAGQLTQGQTCMKDVTVPLQQGAQAFTGQMSFSTDWISFGVTPKNSDTAAGNVFVLYGDETALTQETDSLLLGLQCKVVQACQ